MASIKLQPPAGDREAQETQWLRTIARGGADASGAWECLYSTYRPILLRYLRSFSSQNAVCEDLTQDTLVQAYLSADQHRPGVPVEGWIKRIARNKLLHWVERHDQQMVDPLIDDEPPPALIDLHAWAGVVPPDVVLECRRRRWRAFAERRPRAALALQLSASAGWTIAELADFLHLAESSTKTFVHVERQNARAALAPCEPGP